MRVFIIILMFLLTAYSVNVIESNGKAVKVEGSVTGFRHLTPLACICIAVMTIAYDAASLYLLAVVL